MNPQTFFLCWLGTLIWYSKLLSAAVIMKFCPSSVYLSYQDPPGFPVFAWPLSTSSSPSQSVTAVRPTTPPKNPETRTLRTQHTHIHTLTHTRCVKCFMKCGKKKKKKTHFATEALESVIVISAVIYGQPALNGAFSDSSKPAFLQGNSGCIVTVLIRTASCLLSEIHPASTSKCCSE